MAVVLPEVKNVVVAMPRKLWCMLFDCVQDFRGDCIGNNEIIRTTHNSFTNPDPFVSEEKQAKEEDDDVFHFVSFLPIGNKVYELDGLKPAPIALGTVAEGQSWLEVLMTHLQSRIAKFAEGNIKFNLLAMTGNQLQIAEQQLAGIESQIATATAGEPESEALAGLEQQKAELTALVAEEQVRTIEIRAYRRPYVVCCPSENRQHWLIACA